MNNQAARNDNRPAAEIYLQPQPALNNPQPIVIVDGPAQVIAQPQPPMMYSNGHPLIIPIIPPSIGVPANNNSGWNQNVLPGEPMGIPIYVDPNIDPEFPNVDPSAAVPEINASAHRKPTQIIISSRPIAPAGGENL